ncbi:MAG: hypothetical protein ABFD86_14340, partial [Bryobacteraceae bacterium]
PPRPLGLSEIPDELANELRRTALDPLRLALVAPAGVAYYVLGGAHCLYNFRNSEVEVTLSGEKLKLAADGWFWK